MKTFFILLLCPGLAFARSTLYSADPKLKRSPAANALNSEASKAPPLPNRSWSMVVNGNPIVASSGSAFRELTNFKLGDIVLANVPHSVIAFSDSKAPVSAKIVSTGGPVYILLGDATLERASKRILLSFKSIRENSSGEVFDVTAEALALDGTLGLEGDFSSNEPALFLAEVAAAGAAGFADASVQRTTNVLGQNQDDTSLDTKSKKALGQALSRTADRFAEGQKRAAEFSRLDGPVSIKILFSETPRRKL